MSLQKQLLIWVLGCVLAVGLLIQVIVFWHTYQSFSQSQDNNLSYIAELVSSRASFRLPKQAKFDNPKHSIAKRAKNFNPTASSLPPLAIDQQPHLTANVAKPQSPSFLQTDRANDDNSNDNGMLQYQGIKDGIQVDIMPARVRRVGSQIAIPADYSQLLTLPIGFSQISLSGKVWKVFRKDTQRRIIFVRQPMEWQKKATLQTAWQAIIPIFLSVLVLLFLLPIILKKILRPVQSLANQMARRDELDLSPIVHVSGNYQTALPEELVPLVDEMNSLLARIDKHIKGQNRFIANVAHELRSPLTAISLQAQSLQKQLTAAANYHDPNWQQKLVQSVDRLAVRVENNQHLVEQLLTFARIDAQQATLHQANITIPIMPTLIEAVTLLFPIADSKDINLAIDNQLGERLDDKNWQVAVDETSLLVLLKNLIQNAILYTPNAGDVNVVVTTTSQLDANQNHHPPLIPVLYHSKKDKNLPLKPSARLVMQIKDSGIGVPTEKYQEIFQPFVRLSQSGAQIPNDSLQKSTTSVEHEITKPVTHTGTGLGLSIVYQICQQANIDIYLSPTNTGINNVVSTNGLTVTLVF